MSDSILTSVKKLLGLDPSYTYFDTDVMMHINSVFSTLTQLGLGPSVGFMITDASSTWDEFTQDDFRLNSIKTYVFLRVRTIFDPPQTSFVLDSIKAQILELEWRLNVDREATQYYSPDESYILAGATLDGGDADPND